MYKQSIPIYLLLFIFLALSCKVKEAQMADVMILIDTTDTTFNQQIDVSKDLQQILSWNCININNGSYDELRNGLNVQIASLSDVSDEKPRFVSIKPDTKNQLTGNAEARRKAMLKYVQNLQLLINDVSSHQSTSLQYSKLIINVCQKLKILAKSNSDKKLLIIYSDLIENSEYYTFYKKTALQLEKELENQNVILTKLEQDCIFPNLSNIEIFAIPLRNNKNDQLVNQAIRFWKKMFQKYQGNMETSAQLSLLSCEQKN